MSWDRRVEESQVKGGVSDLFDPVGTSGILIHGEEGGGAQS